jgi:hypothetical protein
MPAIAEETSRALDNKVVRWFESEIGMFSRDLLDEAFRQKLLHFVCSDDDDYFEIRGTDNRRVKAA